MNIFTRVKENVTVLQAAEHYGVEVQRNGMCRCPFHDDHTPSMKLNKAAPGIEASQSPTHHLQRPSEIQTLREASEAFEKDFLKQCLKDCPNHSRLAKQLDISRQTLLNKLQKYGL